MKRSGFKKLSYAEALAKQQAKQAIARLGLQVKNTVDSKIEQPESTKIPSQAAIQGKQRSKQRKAQHSQSEKEWKRKVRAWNDCRCQFPRCTVRKTNIPCHHIAPRSQRKDLIYVLSNGVCLCDSHHSWVHANHQEAEKMKLFSTRSRELAMKEGTIGQY